MTPAETEPTRDAVTYWNVADTPPAGDDPLDALIVRLAAAYEQPWLLKFHLDDVGFRRRPRRRTGRAGRETPARPWMIAT